ncbi:hypothetical protein HYE67_006527 [Fusarium culmorum]|uniref:GLEYA adhesin domain-containing protein n=1 Tax=Fusarium culmorum TaxID=5516 RepID=A0A7S8D9C1_FUSCU|nr:hypothetical protein HYE67_006527 [Fusarium culmorum]
MLFYQVFLVVAAAATAYAGPCKPVTGANTATSGLQEPTSSVTIGSESVTFVGTTDSATASDLVSAENTLTDNLISVSSDMAISISDTETAGTVSIEATTSAEVTDSGITTGPATDESSASETVIYVSHTTGATDSSVDTETQTTAPTDTETSDSLNTGTITVESTAEPTSEQTSDLTTELSTDIISESPTTEFSTTDATSTEESTESPTTTAEFCNENADILSDLSADPTASPFCVSYLSMSTHTITEYQTIDPTNVYQLDLITVTVDALTHIETDYDGWTTDTVTSTRSIETITCLDSAYSYTTPAPTFERGNGTPEKRGQNVVDIPLEMSPGWTEAQTSDACLCLDFEAPTTVTTVVQTVEPTTFITASTDVVTPIEEYTEIITTTSVNIVTSTVTEKKTSTVTGWVVETTFADNNDIAYRRYNCRFNANLYDDGFTTDQFKKESVLASGYMQTLQFGSCNSYKVLNKNAKVDVFDPSQAALVVNAYFYAKETGKYKFNVLDTIDNWGYLWLRDAAYTWDSGAWAIQDTGTGSNPNLWKGESHEIELKKGDAIPFTYLWANGGGCASNDLRVTTPSRRSIPGMEGSTVKACNAGKFT